MVEDHKRTFHTHIKRNREGEEKTANQYQSEELINEKKIHGETKKSSKPSKLNINYARRN